MRNDPNATHKDFFEPLDNAKEHAADMAMMADETPRKCWECKTPVSTDHDPFCSEECMERYYHYASDEPEYYENHSDADPGL